MPEVKISVPVTYGYHGRQELMCTVFDMDFLPDVGDYIHPMKNDTDFGFTMRIKSRFWMEDGKTVLEIHRHVIDPDGEGATMPKGWVALWSDDEGYVDLVERLLANGWWCFSVPPEEHFDIGEH